MKTLIAEQNSPQGKVRVFCRIDGKILYFKFNSNPYANQMVTQFRQKGADITFSKHNSWIRIDFIKDNELVTLDRNIGLEIDTTKQSDEEIEDILINFYKKRYEMAKFKVDVKDERN